jgi:chromate transporter
VSEGAASATPIRGSLGELAVVFLKLGTTAFGGPAAHVAMMEEEVVRRRRWLTREAFLDYVGAANLIPGPNSTELAIHVGLARAGWRGLLVAGACFILPAACIVTAIAAAYVRYGALPVTTGILYGIKPVVIAVIAQALWGLGRTAIRTMPLAALAMAAGVAAAFGVNELAILLGAAVIAAGPRSIGGGPLRATIAVPAVAVAALGAPFALWPLFAVFLKIGAVLFGSGYVLIAFLRNDLVVRLGWLTEAQLLDAVAVGQVTPGPVFTTATFIGYVLGGGAGAVVATLGIFLPAFLFVGASGALVPRIRRSPVAGAALDGVNVASLALMAVVAAQLAHSTLIDVPTVAIAIVSAGLLARFRINSAWLVLAGALIGAALEAAR